MKTILTSISLLLLSILLVIGCEVLDDSLQSDSSSTVEQTEEVSSQVSENKTKPLNDQKRDSEDQNSGKS